MVAKKKGIYNFSFALKKLETYHSLNMKDPPTKKIVARDTGR